MKKLVLLFLLTSLTFVSSKGQIWIEDDAVWHYDFYVSGSGFYKIELGTDTLIQNKNCQRYLITKYTFYQQPGGIYLQGPIINFPSEFTYVSEDTVFYYKNEKFYILFNFNSNVGDQWIVNDEPVLFPSCDSISKVEVIEKGEININGTNRNAILLQTVEGSPWGIDGWIVENIGPLGSQYLFPTGRNCNDSTIICFEQYSSKCFEDSRIGLYNPSGIDCEYLLTHVGIEESKKQFCQIYPNPTSDIINLIFHETGEYQMKLIDQSGKVVQSKILSEKKETINIKGLQNGMYILKFEDRQGNVILKKLIKK
jgi:hypothetical protein